MSKTLVKRLVELRTSPVFRLRERSAIVSSRKSIVEIARHAEVLQLLVSTSAVDQWRDFGGPRPLIVDDSALQRIAGVPTFGGPDAAVAEVRLPDCARTRELLAGHEYGERASDFERTNNYAFQDGRGADERNALQHDWPRPVLILDQIQDPGNVGTLLRTAAFFGWSAVSIGGCDPFNEKAIRAGTGAQFKIPLAIEADVRLVINAIAEADGRRAPAADGGSARIGISSRTATAPRSDSLVGRETRQKTSSRSIPGRAPGDGDRTALQAHPSTSWTILADPHAKDDIVDVEQRMRSLIHRGTDAAACISKDTGSTPCPPSETSTRSGTIAYNSQRPLVRLVVGNEANGLSPAWSTLAPTASLSTAAASLATFPAGTHAAGRHHTIRARISSGFISRSSSNTIRHEHTRSQAQRDSIHHKGKDERVVDNDGAAEGKGGGMESLNVGVAAGIAMHVLSTALRPRT